MRIVAIQLDMAWENKPANHRRVSELFANSDLTPHSLVILPEMFETGFSMNAEKTCQSEQRKGETFLRNLAAKYQVAVMGGVVTPMIAGKCHNEAVVFAPSGEKLARYRKMKPFSKSGEDKAYPAGDKDVIFEWQGVKIAPFICYDLRFPELFRPAALKGAELITLIACWPAVRSEHWVRLLQARAIENLAAVVGVNRTGAEPGLDFDGRSAGFDHMGVSLFELDDKEQVATVDIDVEGIRQWREKFPALRDATTQPAAEVC